jgi:hypothetical protein
MADSSIPELTSQNILMFSAFVVPGSISMLVYRLIVSCPESKLQENIIEAIVFSIANFALSYWIILYALSDQIFIDQPFLSYALLFICLFMLPMFWPFALSVILDLMAKFRWIQPRAKTAWDHYFKNLKQGSYVIVHMNDGSFKGGVFGINSYASGYPNSGELFLEELWEVDETGAFTGEVFEGQGIVLRASEYKFIRVSTIPEEE